MRQINRALAPPISPGRRHGPHEFSTEAEAAPATLIDIDEADLDLGYLALYADELHLVAKPDSQPGFVAEEIRLRAASAAESAQTTDPIVRVPAPYGGGEFSTGVDTPEDLARLPANYAGGV
ncbi:hypothetical protein [Microvirga sp. TS319]|uniref:hypothetical protein n=1 Tax=Microvirga sp. TS319 TaxID=3241165 RepID=UPI003519EEDE